MDAQIWFISIAVKLTNISLTVSWKVLPGRCPDMRIKTQVCFSATNLPNYQNLKTQRIKIITSMCQMTLQDSSDHVYPPTGHVRPWDFVQPWDLVQAWYYCPHFMKIATETQFQFTNYNHWWFEAKWVLGSHAFPSTICPRDRCPAMRSETWVGSFASKILHNENVRTQFIKILKISPSKTSLKDGYHHIFTPAG